jgi:glycerol-3-phosphate O-acyltransferase
MSLLAGATFGLQAVSFLTGRSARKKQSREQQGLTGAQLEQESYELGRTERARAAEERSMFAAAGISTQSGSAAGVESGIMREAVYQQEATLAGLPASQRMRNPFTALGAPRKRTMSELASSPAAVQRRRELGDRAFDQTYGGYQGRQRMRRDFA